VRSPSNSSDRSEKRNFLKEIRMAFAISCAPSQGELMKRTRWIFVFLVQCAFGAAAFAQDFADAIIWRDAAARDALFLPARSFDQSIEALPLSEVSRGALRARTAIRRRQLEMGNERCSFDLHAAPGPVIDEIARTLPQVIAGSEQMFVASDLATVPGWSTWTDEPATLVWVRVEESVGGKSDPKAGTTRAFLLADGAIEINGVRLCSTIGAFHRPVAGERLLIDAVPYENDPRLVSAVHLFPMQGEVITSQPYRHLHAFRPMTLERALALARALREVQQ